MRNIFIRFLEITFKFILFQNGVYFFFVLNKMYLSVRKYVKMFYVHSTIFVVVSVIQDLPLDETNEFLLQDPDVKKIFRSEFQAHEEGKFWIAAEIMVGHSIHGNIVKQLVNLRSKEVYS